MIAEVLTYGWPGQQWSLSGEALSTLEWHPGNSLPRPTAEEITEKVPGYNAWCQRRKDLAAGVAGGYVVMPEGFVLKLEEADRAAFAQMLALVKEALELGMITNETPQLIADAGGTRHEVSTLRFRQVMVGYGLHYKGLWDAFTEAPPVAS